MSPSTLFGAPLGYSPDLLERWVGDLERCWMSFSGGRQSAGLEQDIERLATIYATGVKAATLRNQVAQLDADVEYSIELLPEVALHFDGVYLITPEGRILLETLKKLKQGGGSVIDTDTLAGALALATQTRSDWYLAWAANQLEGSMSPTVIGAALLLAVNGSVGEGAAFVLPKDDPERPAARDAILGIVGRFSVDLGGTAPTYSDLRTHWAFSQVSRLASRDVVRVGKKYSEKTLMYIRAGREEHLLGLLRKNLEGHRPDDVRKAVENLVEAYRANRGLFVALDMMHEQPSRTQRILASMRPGSAD